MNQVVELIPEHASHSRYHPLGSHFRGHRRSRRPSGAGLSLPRAIVCLGGTMRAAISVALICACTLSACSTFNRFTQTQETVSQFDQGVHTVTASEMEFLRQVQAAECTTDFYNQAYKFATAQEANLDLAPQCIPQELTNDELQLRQKLLDAITLYADSLEVLTNGANDSELDSNSSALAKNIESLASHRKFTSVSANDAAGLNVALVTLTEFIIDHHEYTKIRDAASNLQQPLTVIVGALKSENLDDAQGLESKVATITSEFRAAVSSSRDHEGPSSFLDIAQAHSALESILVPAPDVSQLNSALDALVAANQALARPQIIRAMPEISDLTRVGQQAVALFNSSK